jgi:hypothetical protein
VHRDLLEVPELSKFINNVITGEESNYEYITESEPSVENAERLIFQLHSPLDLLVETVSGKIVSSSTNELPGAVYRRYGELQYLSVPRDEDLEVVLDGQAEGSFTLDTEVVHDGEVVERVTMSGVPSVPETKARLWVGEMSDLAELTLAVDYNGDGEVDATYDESGLRAEEAATYADLYAAILESDLKRGPRTVLLVLAKTAEHFALKAEKRPKYTVREQQALKALIRQSILLERKKKLTAEDQDKIEIIVNGLSER